MGPADGMRGERTVSIDPSRGAGWSPRTGLAVVRATAGIGQAVNDDPDARVGAARVREESAGVQAEHALGLQMLRATFGLTQTELAGALGVSRANVAQTEQRGDMLVSTLRRYAETITGGELRLLVTVPGRAPLEFNLIEVEAQNVPPIAPARPTAKRSSGARAAGGKVAKIARP